MSSLYADSNLIFLEIDRVDNLVNEGIFISKRGKGVGDDGDK